VKEVEAGYQGDRWRRRDQPVAEGQGATDRVRG